MMPTLLSNRQRSSRLKKSNLGAGLEQLEKRELMSVTPWPNAADRYDYLVAPNAATDSASAATAMATGIKTDDGNVAWKSGDPAGGALKTIAETLREEQGFAIGVVSTVPFSHATPAAFASHNVSRSNYNAIANEIIFNVQPDVVIGGGNRTWGGNYLSAADQAALETGDTAYTYVGRKAGADGGNALIEAAKTIDVNSGEKLFGLFGGTGGNFEYYSVADAPGAPALVQGSQENPTLAEAVNATLDVLGDDRDGFFVMFEQGDIDWANHANMYNEMVGGVHDLDQAVRAAEKFVDRRGDDINWNNTLVIVTSDHSNSHMRLNQYFGKGDLPETIDKNVNPSTYTGTADVTYGSGGHTNELVTLWARGKGANLFESKAGSWYPGTQIVDNTQIYEVMSRAADKGVDHIILFIGDGMNLEHEIAGSRYLYGRDFALAWQDWGFDPQGFAGFSSTWDVTTYNKYATAQGAHLFDPTLPIRRHGRNSNDPAIGYDPALGGVAPERLDAPGYYIADTIRQRGFDGGALADIAIAWDLMKPTHGSKARAVDALLAIHKHFWSRF